MLGRSHDLDLMESRKVFSFADEYLSGTSDTLVYIDTASLQRTGPKVLSKHITLCDDNLAYIYTLRCGLYMKNKRFLRI